MCLVNYMIHMWFEGLGAEIFAFFFFFIILSSVFEITAQEHEAST